MSLPEVLQCLVPTVHLGAAVTRALTEDLGDAGDITSAVMIPERAQARGAVRARDAGVVAGIPVVLEVLRQAAPSVRASAHVQDGERIEAGKSIVSLQGSLAQMLGAERTLLNFLGHLSGIATTTAQFADAVVGTRAVICDTRKTTPGLRHLEKYAVRCGGGVPHRIGLFDAVLIKDNHVAGLTPAQLAETVAAAATQARTRWPVKFVMVECDTLEQFDAVLALPPQTVDIALLDNMTPELLRQAVNHRDHLGAPLLIEASGNVRLDNVRQIAEAGVDRISVGALTHSAPRLDVGLDIE